MSEEMREQIDRVRNWKKFLNESSNSQKYNVIGFANKYYTLWEVEFSDDFSYFKYLKNLSFDFDTAKEKAGTDNYDETLRGRSRDYIKIKYDNGTFQDFEDENDVMMLSSKMTFGKYKGESILSIVNSDPEYLVWIINNVNNNKLEKLLKSIQPVREILNKDVNYSQKQKTTNETIDEMISLFESKTGLKIAWDKNDTLKMFGTLKSKKIKLTATLETLLIKNLNEKKGTKSIVFDQIPNNKIYTIIKKDPKCYNGNVAKVENLDLGQYGISRTNPAGEIIAYELPYLFPEDLKNKKYEIYGSFSLVISGQQIDELKIGKLPSFDVSKIIIVA